MECSNAFPIVCRSADCLTVVWLVLKGTPGCPGRLGCMTFSAYLRDLPEASLHCKNTAFLHGQGVREPSPRDLYTDPQTDSQPTSQPTSQLTSSRPTDQRTDRPTDQPFDRSISQPTDRPAD